MIFFKLWKIMRIHTNWLLDDGINVLILSRTDDMGIGSETYVITYLILSLTLKLNACILQK